MAARSLSACFLSARFKARQLTTVLFREHSGTVRLCNQDDAICLGVAYREVHRGGNEGLWWRNTGIDPLAAARALWLETRPLPRAEATATSNESTGDR
jgi:hypothetical protein